MSASPNRAILLASLLILSVAPISGIASAEITRGSGNAQYYVSDSSGSVTDEAVIFQGEEDITLRNTTKASDNQVVAPASLTRDVATGSIPLSLPIPQDQTLGEYKNRAGFSVTVTTPRITEFEINNDDGQDVSGGILGADQNATVNIEFNFADSERINLIIESENGVDVTNEFTSANTTINASVANNVPEVDDTAGSVTIPIDPSNVDEGEYTFTAEGDDDFDFGQASQSTTINIISDQQASLEINQERVIQGDTNAFTITNSLESRFHAVVIESSDFRDGVSDNDAANIFRNVGDTVQTGLLSETGSGAVSNTSDSSQITNATHAFAVVEIDGGNGVGSVETQFLDDTTSTIEVYPSSDTAASSYLNNADRIATGQNATDLFSGNTNDDSIDFEITKGGAPPAFVEFNNTTVPTDSSTVTVDRAQFGNQSIPAGEFVVVLHQTDDGTFTGNIGPKIGESFILSAESRSDIIVNLGPLVSQNDTVTQLENSQTLVAVLHRANPDGGTNHGAPLIRNGSRVSDRAQITAQVQPTETETGTQNDGFGVFTAFVALLVTFLGFKRMHQE